MGEKEFEQKMLVKAVTDATQGIVQSSEALRLSTPGGRFHVRWDEGGSATAMGQLAFFAEFLEATGLFARWVEGCPLTYTSPNAPAVTDLLGTWLLSILDGQRRYAHIGGLRGDEVAPRILGMDKLVSDESLRRALSALAPSEPKRCDEARRAARALQLSGTATWMDAALSESTREALRTAWILDIDTTVKLLYGHQAGAEIGYNPMKPGRPSHTLHTYWISNMRLVLDVEVQSGKSHAAKHSLLRLRQLISGLPSEERPALVRGDNAFGNEGVMVEMEEIGQRYLFKLRQTAGVKRLIEQKWQQCDWQNVGHNFHAVEAELRLAGWSRPRRVVVLRRQVKGNLAAEMNSGAQQTLQFIGHSDKIKLWEYAVLVTNTDYSMEALGQLYRGRADCENGFDELKNQWGWGGYTTRDLERCNLSARAVALIYNWWSWCVRLTQHAGQARLLLTLNHQSNNKLKAMNANIRTGLDTILSNTSQLPKAERWPALVRYIISKIVATRPQKTQFLDSPTFCLASDSG